MRTLVHLSDLHFGRVDPALLAPLIDAVHAAAPHAVVVSGDLTQRARTEQFKEARRFLDALPSPQIVVPGNHDVPLYNVVQRFVQPLDKYRRHITDDLEPVYADDEIAILGINTARSLTIKNGRIDEDQIVRARARLEAFGPHRTKVIVTHHPFHFPGEEHEDDLIGRAEAAMAMFSECGADLLLAGHLHASHAGGTAERYEYPGFSALVVQAGTATSTRGRGEANSFNVLEVDSACISVHRHEWDAERRMFTRVRTDHFVRQGNAWRPSAVRQT